MSSIVYISTYLNHHNKPLCDALYQLTSGRFRYVATSRVSEWRQKMGFTGLVTEYMLDYTVFENRSNIQQFVDAADVVVIGASEPYSLIANRLKTGKLTIRSSERLFKTTSRYLKAPIHWLNCFKTRNCHMLCNSAFTERDYTLLGFYRKRCYKWGYFTEVESIDTRDVWETKVRNRVSKDKISITWVARLIAVKHPEVAIYALKRLHDLGYSFDFNMIGDGELSDQMRTMIDSLQMKDYVHMLGSRTTDEVREYMLNSEIHLFTSDKGEGWGAVLNEAMSCACAVVANSEIGSVPYLIDNGVNGLVYDRGSVDSLVDCLVKLLDSYELRKRLGSEAYRTISEEWSPYKAAQNFLQLVGDLQSNREVSIKHGPCSPAWK